MTNDIVNGVNIGDAPDLFSGLPGDIPLIVLSGDTGHVSGSTGFGSDLGDWFAFMPERDGVIVITLSGMTQDLDIYLLDQNLYILDSGWRDGTATEVLYFNVVAGTRYNLFIEPFSGGSPYTLDLELKDQVPKPKENINDVVNSIDIGDAGYNWLTAYHLTPNDIGGVVIRGSTGYYLDSRDWYSFDAQASGMATIVLDGMTADLDLFFYEAGWDAPVVFSVNPGVARDVIQFPVLAGTRYYIEVDDYQGGSPYTLLVTLPITEAGPGAETVRGVDRGDAGDSLAEATWLGWNRMGVSFVSGSVGQGNDTADWFHFVAPATGQVNLGLTGQVENLNLAIFDGTGLTIATQPRVELLRATVTVDIKAGESYFFRVTSHAGAQSYMLDARFPLAPPSPHEAYAGDTWRGHTPHEQSNGHDFAALLRDGSVFARGTYQLGDFDYTIDGLDGAVARLFSTAGSYAALLQDGSVVSWGSIQTAGNEMLQALLHGEVVRIYGSTSFSALTADGRVVAWNGWLGGPDHIEFYLGQGVQSIVTNSTGFAAIRGDGSVVYWNEEGVLQFDPQVATLLSSGVVDILAGYDAFAALRQDGSVVTWGNAVNGGDSSSVAQVLAAGVVKLYTTGTAFAALKQDGSVVSWGWLPQFHIDPNLEHKLSSGVVDVFSSYGAFAALKSDGSVVTWGNLASGGYSYEVADQLAAGVVNVYPGMNSFAVLKEDGSVVTWGNLAYQFINQHTEGLLSSGVVDIVTNGSSYTALKADGSVVFWGDYGMDPIKEVAHQLTSGVVKVVMGNYVSAALKDDGSVVTWGGSNYGGDASRGSRAQELASGVVDILVNGNTLAFLKHDGSILLLENAFVSMDIPLAENRLKDNFFSFSDIFSNQYLLTGSDQDDFIIGFGGRNTIYGHAGDDMIFGGPLDDYIDGGPGTDAVLAYYLPSQYVFANGVLSGPEGHDTLVSIEYVGFGFAANDPRLEVLVDINHLMASDPSGTTPVRLLLERVCDLFIAYFDRAPRPEGLLYWFKEIYQGGSGLHDLARYFTDQDEYRSTYPEGLSNRDFVQQVFQNLFDRDPLEEGWAYWQNTLDDNLLTRDTFIYNVIEGAYAPTGGDMDRLLLTNKHDVSLYYVENLSLDPYTRFDDAITHILNQVSADRGTVAIAREIIDHSFASGESLTAIADNSQLWGAYWG